MSKICFFNHFHNGDLHVSRGIIKKIIGKVKEIHPETEFFYGHSNPIDLLKDISELNFDGNIIPRIKDPHVNLINLDDKLCINTWYAQQNYKYMNPYGLTMDCLYSALDDTCKAVWGFSLSELVKDYSEFFPEIDYSKFEIGYARNWINLHPEKKIFVANGNAMSGQAINFPMMPIIEKFASKYSDKTFILSNFEGNIKFPNIVYSGEIIKKHGSDLNENSFLSSFCEIIIGRSSGASTFAMTQENLFKRKIRILYFTNIVPIPPNKFWSDSIFRDKINFSADILNTNESNPNNVYQLIDHALSMI